MSWRRFLVLFNGLSSQSILIISKTPPSGKKQVGWIDEDTIKDPIEAERAVSRIWG